MTDDIKDLICKLFKKRNLTVDEYEFLIKSRNDEIYEVLQAEALRLRHNIYGNTIYIRGLIEISNYCKNDCFYCGIRRSNKQCERYRLTEQDILSCCEKGYELGFRTFVLQSGEDAHLNDDFVCLLIEKIKEKHSDCAVTLSLGERSRESFQRLFDAGADRYLLRHETADFHHYSKLHPENMKLETRLECLQNLKEIGFQVGCGMMVGSPYQSEMNLAKDLKFIEDFQPDMCGIGPFIPHKDTPFGNENSGSVDLTCFLLALVRIIKPNILLPSTTALGTIDEDGREKGISASANVLMPNLSPTNVRSKYSLYNNKLITGAETAEKLKELKERMNEIGYTVICDRGDIIK